MIRIAPLLLTVIAIPVACSPASSKSDACPQVEIRYIGSEPDKYGNLTGVFSVKNVRGASAEFPLEGRDGDSIHGRFAVTEFRKATEDEPWRAYNPLLDEMYAPERFIRVDSGRAKLFRFDLNGLLLQREKDASSEYSAVFIDTNGCRYRSNIVRL